MLWEPFTVTATTCTAVDYFAKLTQLCQRPTTVHTAVSNHAMIKCGICFLWRSELFKPIMLFFSLANDAMIAQRHWELRVSVCRIFSNCKLTGSSTKRMGKLSLAFENADTIAASMNFILALVINFRIANSCTRWRRIFKRLSQNGWQVNFSKKTSAPLSLTKAFPMKQISAGSISLGSTFGQILPKMQVLFPEPSKYVSSFVHLRDCTIFYCGAGFVTAW